MSLREADQSLPHEYYVDLAQRSPKTPVKEMIPFEKKHGHYQYLNNFYVLFFQRSLKETDPQNAKGEDYKISAMEEKYFDQWKFFLEKNTDLLKQIDLAILGLKPYEDLYSYYLKLLRYGRKTNDYSLADSFEPLLEPVGIYAWRKLNPLLKKAAKDLEKLGINPMEFS